MWDKIVEFLIDNWLNLLLVIVGASAFITYWLQGRQKISEAASLIVMQVEDLQKRMREIKTYISEGQLNGTAFYESQVLFKTDYWDKYKHYFIRRLDPFSFGTFDEFYSCASEVMEQQELMKSLQKNGFFLNQQTIMQMEANLLLNTLNSVNHLSVDNNKVIDGLMATYPGNITAEQKGAMENMLKQVSNASAVTDANLFFSLYNKDKTQILQAFNQDAFTRYTPEQIKISLQKALSQFDSIPIIGCKGYNKLKKMAERRI